MMKISIFVVLLLGLQDVATVMHSWKAFYTGTTGMSEFPEFVALNLLDDELMGYFDSKTNRFEGKQSWVTEKLGQEYVEQETNVLRGHVPTFKGNIDIAMKRFNQSQGIHVNQLIYGCEWDDETEEVVGFHQYGHDGEDLLVLDFKTMTWIAPKPQAVITKQKWETTGNKAYWDNYLRHECTDWLKKYLKYGESSLMRTDIPTVSLLQKSSSSPVSCLATGFYPNRAEMFWRKDGEEIHDGVEKGDIIPNNDGTFQMTVHLDHSSLATHDGAIYECVFQLAGEKDIVRKLEKAKIRRNEDSSGFPTGGVVGGVIGGCIGVAVLVGIIVGVLRWRKTPNGFKKANSSETSSSSSGDSNPKKVNSEQEKMIEAIS